MDNCFSIALEGDTEMYESYGLTLPREQAQLLQLWGFLGIPHKQSKQVWGETLTIIGFMVDPNELSVTLPASRKDDLVVQSLNIFSLLHPALSNVYNKMKGKSQQSAQIFVNKAVRDDLTWFAKCTKTSSGVYLFANIDWDP
ncbi:hypothetical protein EV368DRAFT_76353 [Lentinula lateritia]|nr:hypothetical protein EV368DRAFT_76353 [Lentinula lateritia]